LSPEVLARKLAKLREFLSDLKKFEDASREVVVNNHYAIERLLQLLVEVATDILAHELSSRGVVPTSYRETIRKGVEEGYLSPELGVRLERATGLRNVLVHLYEELDMDILGDSINPALEDFGEFLRVFQSRLEEMGEL
jgi:uncharacterized protein YutE (UPF0331/DUF86 family)